MTPRTTQGAALDRSGVTSTPTPLPTRPAQRPAEAEVERHDVGRLARLDEDRQLDALPVRRDLHDVLVLEAEPLGRGGRDDRGVVPGQLAERLRELLEPAVVREAAVEERRVGPEDGLERRTASAAGRRGEGPRDVGDADGERLRRERRAGDDAVVERLAPERLEVGLGRAGPLLQLSLTTS